MKQYLIRSSRDIKIGSDHEIKTGDRLGVLFTDLPLGSLKSLLLSNQADCEDITDAPAEPVDDLDDDAAEAATAAQTEETDATDEIDDEEIVDEDAAADEPDESEAGETAVVKSGKTSDLNLDEEIIGLLQAAGLETIAQVEAHPDLEDIEKIGRSRKQKILAAVAEYEK